MCPWRQGPPSRPIGNCLSFARCRWSGIWSMSKKFQPRAWAWPPSDNIIRRFPTIRRSIAHKIAASKSAFCAMSELEDDSEFLAIEEDKREEQSNLWVISYSDFMTILMIFFLILFGHRVWSKNVIWEAEKV